MASTSYRRHKEDFPGFENKSEDKDIQRGLQN